MNKIALIGKWRLTDAWKVKMYVTYESLPLASLAKNNSSM